MKSVAPKRVLSATIAFVIVTTVLVGIGVWRLREDAVASALRETDNITTILAEQAGHSARAIDIILDEVLAGLSCRRQTWSRSPTRPASC